MREEQVEMEAPVAEVVSTAAVALKADRYRPRIYGFQLNETAKLQRWQEAVRDRLVPSVSFADNRNQRRNAGRWQDLKSLKSDDNIRTADTWCNLSLFYYKLLLC